MRIVCLHLLPRKATIGKVISVTLPRQRRDQYTALHISLTAETDSHAYACASTNSYERVAHVQAEIVIYASRTNYTFAAHICPLINLLPQDFPSNYARSTICFFIRPVLYLYLVCRLYF